MLYLVQIHTDISAESDVLYAFHHLDNAIQKFTEEVNRRIKWGCPENEDMRVSHGENSKDGEAVFGMRVFTNMDESTSKVIVYNFDTEDTL